MAQYKYCLKKKKKEKWPVRLPFIVIGQYWGIGEHQVEICTMFGGPRAFIRDLIYYTHRQLKGPCVSGMQALLIFLGWKSSNHKQRTASISER